LGGGNNGSRTGARYPSAPLTERMPYAIRRLSDGQVVGTSAYFTASAKHGGVEIGATLLRPDVRAGLVNPESKILMLGHAFDSGAARVQFKVGSRNERSQAAVAKLGAVKEGVLRRDMRTWTGHQRDTVVFSKRALQATAMAAIDNAARLDQDWLSHGMSDPEASVLTRDATRN
jgi:RimJ/RimL family protein N-acetyltransferase